MDRGQKIARLLPGIALLAAPGAIFAHPHSYVDQQAQIAIGRTNAVVTYRITPSREEGAHMFDHVDTNRDARISETEKRAAALALLARTQLTLDGRSVTLRLVGVRFPVRGDMAIGRGVIEIRARADWAMSGSNRHIISFDVLDRQFARWWFLQPFYFADVANARNPPVLARQRNRTTVRINIPAR